MSQPRCFKETGAMFMQSDTLTHSSYCGHEVTTWKRFFSFDFMGILRLLLSEIQTFGSQSQSRRTVTAGWPKDPRRSWMPGGREEKKH